MEHTTFAIDSNRVQKVLCPVVYPNIGEPWHDILVVEGFEICNGCLDRVDSPWNKD